MTLRLSVAVLTGASLLLASAPPASSQPAAPSGARLMYGRMVQAPAPNGTGPVSWTSSDPAVATVDGSGRVTLIRRGTATVTAIRGTSRLAFPVTVLGFSKLAHTVGSHTCAVDDDRTGIYCWGQNLWTLPLEGPPQLSGVSAPQQIVRGDLPASARIADVAVGTFAACALTEAGTVHCFGSAGPHTPLGHPINAPTPSVALPPQQVTGTGLSAGVTAIAVGPATACAATASGGLACWGWGQQIPQPGPIRDNRFQVLPMAADLGQVRVGGGHQSVAVSTNGGCVLSGGGAWCWGGAYLPAKVDPGESGGVSLQAIASDDFRCALDTAGQALCSGTAFGARYGRGQAAFLQSKAWLAVDQSASGPFKTMTLGQIANVACGLSSAGDAWCWGRSHMGSAGDGKMTDHDVLRPAQTVRGARPADVAYVDISCGEYHCIALGDDGRLYGWGSNQGTILGPDPTGRFVGAAVPVLLPPPR